MMSYLHTKFYDNWISSFRGIAMTRFWEGQTDRRADSGRSDCTPRPAFAFGKAGKNMQQQLHCQMLCNKIWRMNFTLFYSVLILKLYVKNLSKSITGFKFVQLLSVHNTHYLCNLGKYVYFAFESRECILS